MRLFFKIIGLFLFSIILIFCRTTASAQSCPQSIIFSTQEQIDNFQTIYPNCTEIEGYVEINGGDITNLNGLNVLTSLGNTLTIANTNALTDLKGLDNLTSIGIHLQIMDNDALTNLRGLDNLTSIGSALLITNNLVLDSLKGLGNLTSIGWIMTIGYNPALTSMEGLDKVTTIGGDVLIEQNPALTNLDGLGNLTSITGFGSSFPTGGQLVIADNDALTSLKGLGKLTSIEGDLHIYDNNTLTSLAGLDNIKANSILHLWIWENNSLSTCEVKSVCDYLLAPNGQILISGNTTGCNSHEEVEDACGSSIILTKPVKKEVFISGESDTIRWETLRSSNQIKLEYSEDNGTTYKLIAKDILSGAKEYIWQVPDNILTSKAKVRILDQGSNDKLAISDRFYIKPYQLTRLESNGDLVGYDINKDIWGFSNIWSDMWPSTHYNNINYSGLDPHTKMSYDHRQAPVFVTAKSSDYTPWEDFVDAFTTNACYRNVLAGIYNPQALVRWESTKMKWGGSCFAIAVSNALAFSEKQSFANVYNLFPSFSIPLLVTSNKKVIKSMARLYSHASGFPSQKHWTDERKKTTPKDVVLGLKEIFSQKDVKPKTISFFHWLNKGAHTVLPYKLRQDPVNDKIFYVDVYDNQYPNDQNAYIKINISTPPFPSTWEYSHFPNWGGHGKKHNLILDLNADVYLSSSNLFKSNKVGKSQFNLSDNDLQIGATDNTDITIRDRQGNSTGYHNDSLWNDIEGSLPLIIPTGDFSLPYGYNLPLGEYTVILDNYTSDTLGAYFFYSNIAYTYDRTSAIGNQSDRLTFGEGISVVNPDSETRSVKLEMIISEESRDKVFRLDSFSIHSMDSVRIQTPDNNYIKLHNYGTSKFYQVELNSFSSEAFERFLHKGIPIGENTLHVFEINWTDVDESVLHVYVDENMDGSYEDTLVLNNIIVGIDEIDGHWNRNSLNLSVVPNPVDNIALFNFDTDRTGKATIKFYDVNGKEVATSLNQVLKSGKHQIQFDASSLPDGIYFYRITIGSMSSTGKMVVLR